MECIVEKLSINFMIFSININNSYFYNIKNNHELPLYLAYTFR